MSVLHFRLVFTGDRTFTPSRSSTPSGTMWKPTGPAAKSVTTARPAVADESVETSDLDQTFLWNLIRCPMITESKTPGVSGSACAFLTRLGVARLLLVLFNTIMYSGLGRVRGYRRALEVEAWTSWTSRNRS